MSVEKINTAELETEKRFHANQADVPGKSAQEMKEFMDYIPRQVIIPKVNELVDAANAAAPAADVYTKTETEEKLSKKANAADVYDKSQVYTKSEVLDRTQDKATIAYVNTELGKKANSSDVYAKSDTYQKTETDALLSSKLSTDSDRIIQDVENQPQSDSALICRENGVLKIFRNVEVEPIYDGAMLDDYGAPAPCAYNTEEEFIAAIEAHGLTDTTSTGGECIYLFKVYSAEGTLHGKMEIRHTPRSGYYMYFSWTDSGVLLQWYDQDWAAGSANVTEKFAKYGYTNLTVDEVSDFAKQVFCGTRAEYSEIATKEYVDKLIQNLQASALSAGVSE